MKPDVDHDCDDSPFRLDRLAGSTARSLRFAASEAARCQLAHPDGSRWAFVRQLAGTRWELHRRLEDAFAGLAEEVLDGFWCGRDDVPVIGRQR